jgi:hypothetical protein
MKILTDQKDAIAAKGVQSYEVDHAWKTLALVVGQSHIAESIGKDIVAYSMASLGQGLCVLESMACIHPALVLPHINRIIQQVFTYKTWYSDPGENCTQQIC